jgi:hypothetical protein
MILKTSQHLERGFHNEARFGVIHEASKQLCEVDFDVLVVMGISGVVMGSVLAYQMNKRLAVVRKRGERDLTTSGFSSQVEGYVGGRFIFFDDLISSGESKHWAISEFKKASEAAGESCQYVGTYLWNHNDWRPHESPPAPNRLSSQYLYEWAARGPGDSGSAPL